MSEINNNYAVSDATNQNSARNAQLSQRAKDVMNREQSKFSHSSVSEKQKLLSKAIQTRQQNNLRNWYNPLALSNPNNISILGDMQRGITFKAPSKVSSHKSTPKKSNTPPSTSFESAEDRDRRLTKEAESAFEEIKKHADYNDPVNKLATLKNLGYISGLQEQILSNASKNSMSEKIINDYWDLYLRDNLVTLRQGLFRPGLSDAELEKNRLERELAVRQNQLNNGFFLNIYGSNPVSDKYAYEHPDIINDRTNANGVTARAVALAPLSGVAGSVPATATFAAMGFAPPLLVFGTIRRGFKNGADDALLAWRYGNSGFFDEDFAEENPRTAFFGNMLGDLTVGGVATGALSDIKNMWNYARSKGYEPETTILSDVVPSPYNGITIYNPSKGATALEAAAKVPTINVSGPDPSRALPAPVEYSLANGNVPKFDFIEGVNYAKMLGIDSEYNTMIRAALQRPTPTIEDITNALNEVIDKTAPGVLNFMNRWLKKSGYSSNPNVPLLKNGDAEAYFNVEPYEMGTSTQLLRDLLQGRPSPLLHIDFLPHQPGYSIPMTPARQSMLDYGVPMTQGVTDPYSMMFFQQIRKNILSDSRFRGLDITSSSNVGMPYITFLSRLKENPNLTDVQKWLATRDFITNPEKFYTLPFVNWGDYSTDSYNLAITANKPNLIVSPALYTRVGALNQMGVANKGVKDLFKTKTFIPNISGITFPLPKIDDLRSYPVFAPFSKQAELMYNTWQNPFNFYPIYPVISIKKKGGKLVKRKYKLNLIYNGKDI